MYGKEEELKYTDSEEIEYRDSGENEYSDSEETEVDSDGIEYMDSEEISPVIRILFITLTVLGALVTVVILGVWYFNETGYKEQSVSAFIHRDAIGKSAVLAEEIIETDQRLQEERRAAEEAARLEAEAAAKAEEEAKKDLGMIFSPVEETVTAKDSTNLRDIPSQGDDSTVVLTLQNGQTATRIGISNQGWSKLEYDGQIYYAVSNYLTTDLTVKPQEAVPEDDGIKTVFTACNDMVTPKIEVNLRALPSVTNPDAAVVATIRAGEVVQRTGINTDVGWSRVVYNGQTLYCVSSYVYVVQ